MNIFEDRWDSLEVKRPMVKYDMSVYCFGFEWICSACCEKYGEYAGGVTEHFKEEKECDWCNEIKTCVPPQFAGWPDHLTIPEINNKIEII